MGNIEYGQHREYHSNLQDHEIKPLVDMLVFFSDFSWFISIW